MLGACHSVAGFRDRLDQMATSQSMRAAHLDAQWNLVASLHSLSWCLLGLVWTALIGQCHCAYRLFRSEWRWRSFEKKLRRIQRCGPPLPKDLELTILRETGGLSQRLFDLADKDQELADELASMGRLPGVSMVQWSYEMTSQYHERIGCQVEDIAEWLALSADPAFAV